MVEKCVFEDFNIREFQPKDKVAILVDELLPDNAKFDLASACPKIYQLLRDTTGFYRRFYGDLLDKIVREKRQINFETPHRAEMIYEYSLENFELVDNLQYLFNTQSRLNWLQCYANNQPIDIASKQTVIELLHKTIDKEIHFLSNKCKKKESVLYEWLYENSNGKPCFVNLGNVKEKLFSLKIRYFSAEERMNTSGCMLLNPIRNKTIVYSYNPLNEKSSCWLYVKGPSRFKISFEEKFSDVEYPKHEDSEVLGAVFRKHRKMSYDFKIKVNVPDGLSGWLLAIYGMSLCACVGMYLACSLRYFGIPIVAKWVDVKLICAMIAGIITTRGWLIYDEYILKTLSKAYTLIVIILVILCFSWLIINGRYL